MPQSKCAWVLSQAQHTAHSHIAMQRTHHRTNLLSMLPPLMFGGPVETTPTAWPASICCVGGGATPITPQNGAYGTLSTLQTTQCVFPSPMERRHSESTEEESGDDAEKQGGSGGQVVCGVPHRPSANPSSQSSFVSGWRSQMKTLRP